MALTGTDRGTDSTSAAGTSWLAHPGSTIPAGSVGVVFFGYDNAGTGGADPFSSIATDSTGEVWTLISNVNSNAGAAANSGVSFRAFMCRRKTPFGASDGLTINFSTSVTAAVAIWNQIDTDQVNTVVRLFTLGGGSGASTAPTASITPGSGSLILGVTAAEQTAAITADSDTTNGSWSTQQSVTVGSGATGQEIATQRKVTSAGGAQTYNTTITSTDWVCVLFEFTEAVAPFIQAAGLLLNVSTDTTSYPAAGFFPFPQELVVVCVVSSDTALAGTLTSTSGVTYSLVRLDTQGAETVRWYVADRPAVPTGTPAGEVLTWDCTGDAATGALIFVWRIFGIGPWLGLSAVRNQGAGSSGVTGTPAVTMPKACQPTNIVLGCAADLSSTGVFTPPASYVEVGDTGYATPATGADWVQRESGETATTITWGASVGSAWLASIIELGNLAPKGTVMSQAVQRAAAW